MTQIIVITGASSGFGNLTAKALTQAGHTVYAGIRDEAPDNPSAQALSTYAATENVSLHPITLNVLSEASLRSGIHKIISETGRIDVLIHNAGHMAFGPTEAFTPDQLATIHDVNCLGTHRLNRVVLPYMRQAGKGLLIWVSSSSTRGGVGPYMGPYFAAKAAMDSLAVTYAGELSQWGIETSIVVPGAYTKGTNHFANATGPAEKERLAEYEEGPYRGMGKRVLDGHGAVEPKDSDPVDVARAIVDVVGMKEGKRPFRVHVGTEADGAEVVNPVADFARGRFMKDLGIGELLTVKEGPGI